MLGHISPATGRQINFDQGLVTHLLVKAAWGYAFWKFHQRGARPGKRVKNRSSPCPASQDLTGGLDGQIPRLSEHYLMIALDFLVNPVDRRSWQCIMKLMQQNDLPGRIQGGRAKIKTLQSAGCHSPQFRFTQGNFALSVAFLGPGLRGIRPAVVLKIKLADITVPERSTFFKVFEEFHRSGHVHSWNTFEVSLSP